MRRVSHRNSARRGSTLILVMLMLPVFLIPLIGLAIDGTMMYIVQTKLQSACDGAALAAGRLIGTTANTAEIAGEVLNVNFPAGYWGSSNLVPTITATDVLGVHTIQVQAQVNVPYLFLRVIGLQQATMPALAVATRKDTRTVMVLDRSGSMNNVISGTNVFTTMVSSAKLFVGMMTPGLDELGLVVFDGGAVVAYPEYSLPYSMATGNGGGPDVNFATSSTAGPIFNQLSLLAAGGGTGMTEGLSMAYLELQKAHNRDLAAKGTDTALNNIVLFTDGVADSLAVSPNNSANPVLAGGSGCKYTSEPAGNLQMLGYMVATGNPPWSHSQNTTYALFDLPAYDPNRTLSSVLSNPGSNFGQGDLIEPYQSTPLTNCNGLNSNGNNYNKVSSTVATVPPFDIYGNSTNGTAYNLSTLSYDGTSYNNALPSEAYQFALAAWNSVDNAGQTIRSQNNMLPITIYTIGFTGDGGTDAELLRRLANTQTATSYNPQQPVGMYIEVNNPNDLAGAFSFVASQVLRLAK